LKRRKEQPDSLELLLDTICNIFGGIILMAILVVIQVHSTAESIPVKSEKQIESSLKQQKMKFDCDRLQEQIEALKKQYDNLLREQQERVSENTMKLLQHKGHFDKSLRELEETQRETDSRLKVIIEQNNKTEHDLESLKKTLAVLHNRSDFLSAEIQKKKTTKEKKMRLPYRHYQSSVTFYNCIVYGKKLFHFPNAALDRKISSDCLIEPRSFGTSYKITPIEQKGYYIIPDNIPGSCIQSMSDFKAVNFFVCSDDQSYETFQVIKNFVLSQGKLYRASSYPKDEGLIVTLVSELPVE